MVVEPFDEHVCELGEGPIWDARTHDVLWLDVLGQTLHRRMTNGTSTRLTLDNTVAAIAPRRAGGYIAATAEGPARLQIDGPEHELELLSTYADADRAAGGVASENVRGNDAAVDPAGRFWLGTMGWDAQPQAGSLYRLGAEAPVADRILSDVTISNGLGWSQDGRSMYYIDSPTQRVDVFDFDPVTSEATERRTLVEVPPEQGTPDGLSVDAQGGIWVALFGGAAVHRYGSDGRLEHVLTMPCQQPTSCAFVGADLRELVITSAAVGLDVPSQFDGSTFIADVGVAGLPTTPFAG